MYYYLIMLSNNINLIISLQFDFLECILLEQCISTLAVTLVGWLIDWRTIISNKFSHCCEGSESHVRPPAWGSDKGTGNPQGIWPLGPVVFDYRISRGLRVTEAPVLEAHTKFGTYQHGRLNQNYLLYRAFCRSVGQQGLTTGMGALDINPLRDCYWPSGQTTLGKECNPTHQQIIGLKFYWARPCWPEQDPAFLIANTSHQEAYTSLLASSIRGQREESKSSTIS